MVMIMSGGVIDMAVAFSVMTCEACGSRGGLIKTAHGWVKCLCASCRIPWITRLIESEALCFIQFRLRELHLYLVVMSQWSGVLFFIAE